ncbi:MAG TPA: bifunctional folylpolyglutamate synthase/dihydrofolate synthase [Thermoplasmatales archaeon]|nr:bifunctional folylpolyglutamate synthase/dihydrofolate synthase [Thermoplasmatales archaeon]
MIDDKEIEWLNDLKRFGIRLELGDMKYLMHKLNYPYKEYNVVHVGGTNGKGSVCQFIASVLLKAGYAVGTYTTPPLHDIHEIYRINNRLINERELGSVIRKLKKEVSELIEKGKKITYFEALTALALLYFQEKMVDYAIIEVGLGGRCDATNVVDAAVTVITNVALEHENFLGRTVATIAREKAGIITHAPVVTACRGEALAVIREVAAEKDVPVYVVGEDIIWKRKDRRRFVVEADDSYIIQSPLDGIFQGENIALAVKVGEILGMGRDDIISGIAHARLPGRMEKMGRFLLDGCHNPHAVQAFARSLEEYDYRRLVILFGVMRDKNVREMIRKLPDAERYIAVTVGNERSMDAEHIARIGRELGKPFEVGGGMAEALDMAGRESSDGDLICIVGSLYAVGEARKILREKTSFPK